MRSRWRCRWTGSAVLPTVPRPTRVRFDAALRVLFAGIAREPERGADRLAPADAARRDDPTIERRHLFLAAARSSRSEEGRADRARRAGSRRRPGDPDADDPAS